MVPLGLPAAVHRQPDQAGPGQQQPGIAGDENQNLADESRDGNPLSSVGILIFGNCLPPGFAPLCERGRDDLRNFRIECKKLVIRGGAAALDRMEKRSARGPL